MNATVLFETPQREISSLINSKLSACENASIVTGLKRGEGSPMEKDALALELAKPESGSFILVSLRRRHKDHTGPNHEP